jgi:hypothetical protein
MKLKLEAWQKWCAWIVAIREDLSDVVDDQATFDSFRDVVEANGEWLLRDLQGGHFIDFIKRGYVTKTVFGIRRHLKSKGDSISLKGLIEQVQECADQITFDFYLERFPREPNGHPWQEMTFRQFSRDGRKVCSDIVGQHLLAIDSLRRDIEAMADRTLAHLDKRGFDGTVTFKDLREGVATFNKLTCKYIGLLLAKGYSSLEATVLYDWEKVFRQPWDRRPA